MALLAQGFPRLADASDVLVTLSAWQALFPEALALMDVPVNGLGAQRILARDVAAMLDAGLCVLGRPSNVGGIAVLTAYLKRHDMNLVIVLGENDCKPHKRGTVKQCPKDCRGCAWCWPGRFGMLATAQRLERALRRKVESQMPPDEFKDARQWWLGNGLAGIQEVKP